MKKLDLFLTSFLYIRDRQEASIYTLNKVIPENVTDTK